MSITRSASFVLSLVAVAAVACEPSASSSTSAQQETSSAAPTTTTSPPTGVDPLVPYSPAPGPVLERTSGWAGDTLTLPHVAGGTMRVTLLSTAIGPEATADGRALSLWLRVVNADGPAWSGFPGGFITVTDMSGTVWEPVPTPTAADLHPDPERYGASNLDLHEPRTLEPGATVNGVSVFRLPGWYRPVTIAISFDRGATWGTWETSFGPS